MKNPYFIEDFTILNREIEAKKCFAPEDWEKMGAARREEVIAQSKPYTLLNLFVYEGHEIFPPYTLRVQSITYYMIDFRNVNTLKCDMVKRPENMKEEDLSILEAKYLQLSDTVREELRNKMAYYYGRPAEEEVLVRTS